MMRDVPHFRDLRAFLGHLDSSRQLARVRERVSTVHEMTEVHRRALGDLFVPILRRQLPEVVDCWFPPDACSYRIAVVSIRKRYPGQARRVMMGLWGMLAQFSYTKLVVVVDDDIDVRNWRDVAWALATRMDPSRDAMLIHNTPIDYLDFASPLESLGGKLGLDATNKLGSETSRQWGRKLAMDARVCQHIDALWPRLGLSDALMGEEAS